MSASIVLTRTSPKVVRRVTIGIATKAEGPRLTIEVYGQHLRTDMIDVTAVREPDGEAVRLRQVTEGADATVSGDIHPMVECAIGAACNETYVVTMELLSSTVDRLDVTLACLFYPGNVKVPPGAGETLSISD